MGAHINAYVRAQGKVCLLKGASSCLSVTRGGEESEIYTRNNQPKDSVQAMKAMGAAVPACVPPS
jgi:hypothetical protein